MITLDGIAIVVFTPIALLLAFGIGSLARGLFIKDTYKIDALSMIVNCIIGIVIVFIAHHAFN